MKVKSSILAFVKGLTLEDLELIYHDYDNGSYDDLLPFPSLSSASSSPHKNLTIIQQRKILVQYLEHFIMDGDYENDERPETLTNMVAKNDIILVLFPILYHF